MKHLIAKLQRVGIDGFFGGLLVVVALAYLWPEVGSAESRVPWRTLSSLGVVCIFFAYGLRLSPEKLRAGLRNWRLHLLVQLSTFALFPLLALAVRPLFAGTGAEPLWSSIFYLCALPSTVSTSVVMVSIAGGNMPAAIFNATLSGLLGLVLTPLWVSTVLHTADTSGGLSHVAFDLARQVVLPVVLGALLHRRLGAWAERHRQGLRRFDQAIILLMVYTSFCESFRQGAFRSYSAADVLLLAAGMLALFGLVFGLITLLSRMLGFEPADRLTAVFCGSKKSLVHGTVMAKVLFPTLATGTLLLPTMLYHALQILLASMLAQAAARRAAGTRQPISA